MSKPTAGETKYMAMLADKMLHGEIRCQCYHSMRAVERHHPKGPLWGTGTSLKAHDFFVLPLSKEAHDEYHKFGVGFWEAKYGSHATLLKSFWSSIGLIPGEWMMQGMPPRRAEWLRAVLEKVLTAEVGMASYEMSIHG